MSSFITNAPMVRMLAQKVRSKSPIAMPTMVRLSIRQEFGIGEGRTLSVVDDIAKKSPVIIEMTISIGVKIACLVSIKPKYQEMRRYMTYCDH